MIDKWLVLGCLPGFAGWFFLLMALPAVAASPCDAPQWVSPRQFEVLTSARPLLTWAPVTGAASYEVAIESRVPEGEVLFKVSQQTSTPAFTPSTLLTRERAFVSVSVLTLCADGTRSLPAERVFFVDAQDSCPLPAGLQTMRLGNNVRITWPDRMLKVEARFFSGEAASPGEAEVSTSGALVLPLPTAEKRLLGIRRFCPDATSHWLWLRF